MEKIAKWGVLDRQLTNRERWLSFWTLFAYGFISIYNVYKISSVLTYLCEIFQISSVTVLIAMPSILGLILIFPATWLLRKFGCKSVIMISFVIMMIGTIGTFWATDSFSYIAWRTVEAVGNQIVAVSGPQIMVRLFPQNKQGLVMGIWSTWVPFGAIGAFFTVPLLFAAFSWQGIYVFTLVLQIIVFVLILFFFKMPAVEENRVASNEKGELPARKSYFASAIVVAAAFTCYVICQAGVTNTFYPTYLQTTMGMSTFLSSMPTLVASIVSIPVSFITGVLADKLNSRKYFIVIPYLIMAIMYATFAFTETPNAVSPWAYGVLLGLCAGVIPMAVRSIIPVLAYEPAKVDYALGLMAWVSPLGCLLAAFFSNAVAAAGYQSASLFMLAPIMAVAFIVMLFVKNDHNIEPPASVEAEPEEA